MGTTNILDLNNRVSDLEKAVSGGDSASDVAYDNTVSGLTATNVQGAVDEVVEKMGNTRMTKIWENPNPTENMAPNTEISINDAGYDLLAYVCFLAANNNRVIPLVLAPVNSEVYACYADASPKQRRFDRSPGKVTALSGYNGGSGDNSVVILYQIYGINLL